jgi:hypothetical protein
MSTMEAIFWILFLSLDLVAYFSVEPRKRRRMYFMPPGGGFAALIMYGRKDGHIPTD